jgi:signal transduction histidine kinase/CheY-like chemotaxis protein
MIRLAVLVLAATLPAVGVLAYLQQGLRDDHRQRMGEEALRQAELFNADLRSVVEGARQLSLAISHMPMVQTGDAACRTRLTELADELPAYAVMQVVTWDGRIICASAGEPEQLSAEAMGRLRATIEKGSFNIGAYLPATPSHGAIVPIYLPFTMADGQHAVIVLGLSVDWLAEHLSTLKRPSDSTIGIADRNGTTVARYPAHASFVGKPFPPNVLPFVSAQHAGTAVVTGYDGIGRLIGFVPPTEARGLFVSIGMSLPAMMADIDDAARRGTILIAIGAALSFLAALVLGHYFMRRPTTALLSAAQRWSSGDLSARAQLRDSSATEFGRLSAAFNSMAEALGRQRAEMQELNATLESRVAERTRELTESRNRLQIEMTEREKSDASLRRSHKLQAVGQLAGGIAHDFNNLLTTVIGALDLLRRRLPTSQKELVGLVDNALQIAERGSKLTGQLLAFSRRSALVPVPTDLNATVTALSTLLGSTLDRSISIQTNLAEDLWPAMIDPNQIDAAILNLAINARDAMPDGGVLTITTCNVPVGIGGATTARCSTSPPCGVARMTSVPPGDYVAVRVTDNGTGMSPEVLARVFEPFFTTKEPGNGTGLGLAQVHGLVVQSGGDVYLESTLGEGTTVTLLLPRAASLPSIHSQVTRLEPRRSAHVLLVDDDKDVLNMTADMVSERGYTVELANCGAEALEILKTTTFDVMLADYNMPGMKGVELIERAKKLYPKMKYLLMTGHAELADGEMFGSVSVLRKPFRIAVLDERLAQLVNCSMRSAA